MFGKLSLSAIPFENPIIMGAVGGSILLAVVILSLITYRHLLQLLQFGSRQGQ